MDDKYPFYLDPMPNLYFTRDPQASIGRGMTVNRVWRARRRESISFHILNIILDLKMRIFLYGWIVTVRSTSDELVLSKDVLAIGISERTAQAIERLARRILKIRYLLLKRWWRLRFQLVEHLCT